MMIVELFTSTRCISCSCWCLDVHQQREVRRNQAAPPFSADEALVLWGKVQSRALLGGSGNLISSYRVISALKGTLIGVMILITLRTVWGSGSRLVAWEVGSMGFGAWNLLGNRVWDFKKGALRFRSPTYGNGFARPCRAQRRKKATCTGTLREV